MTTGSDASADGAPEPLGRGGPEPPCDPLRFEGLFADLYGGLFALTYRLVGDAGDTEDVVQEAFVRLARDPVLTRPEAEIRAWLRRVCLNLGSNHLRARDRARQRVDRVGRLDARTSSPGAGSSPLTTVLRAEERREVRAALGRLPDRQRDVLLLRHSGYSYAEIAATVGVAIGSVGVLLARGEQRFKEQYERHSDALS